MEIKEAKRYDMYVSGEDLEKQKFYEEHVYTSEELKKIDSMRTKINVYLMIVKDCDESYEHQKCYLNEGLTYFEGIGYIKTSRFLDNEVRVLCYGENEEEAFVNIIKSFEWWIGLAEAMALGSEETSKMFNERFPQNESDDRMQHFNFFAAEHVIRSFRKYYGCGIPTPLVKYFEQDVSETEDENFEYSYKDKGFVIKKKTSLF